jgi:hypothetical protein
MQSQERKRGETLTQYEIRMEREHGVTQQENADAATEAEQQTSLANPFDPRSEISADAKHIAGRIVKHMRIIFVALPLAAGILYAVLNR